MWCPFAYLPDLPVLMALSVRTHICPDCTCAILHSICCGRLGHRITKCRETRHLESTWVNHFIEQLMHNVNCRLAVLRNSQVQSLPNLTGFLTVGTTACLTALGITIAKLAQHPVPGVRACERDASLVFASDRGMKGMHAERQHRVPAAGYLGHGPMLLP
jgi:hypothetical protein